MRQNKLERQESPMDRVNKSTNDQVDDSHRNNISKSKKRQNTIASISDEANDEKIKREMQDKIDANQHIIDQMQKNALLEGQHRVTGEV